jgi:hypothetical protein
MNGELRIWKVVLKKIREGLNWYEWYPVRDVDPTVAFTERSFNHCALASIAWLDDLMTALFVCHVWEKETNFPSLSRIEPLFFGRPPTACSLYRLSFGTKKCIPRMTGLRTRLQPGRPEYEVLNSVLVLLWKCIVFHSGLKSLAPRFNGPWRI